MADRDDALAFLRNLMDDTTASMANRIRAAEAIVRGDKSSASGTGDELHALSDAELLAAARGEEGGIPPREGPNGGGLPRVPSQPPAEHGARVAAGVTQEAHPLAGPDHKAPGESASPFLKRGPKEDPRAEEDPFRNLALNRKRSEQEMTNPISPHLASEQQIGDDPAPWE
jgi:hypothetical protein